MATNITNLPVDVLSRIISTVAVLPDGAREVAKSMSTCQRFLEASDSVVVLRAVCFQNVQVLDRCHLFQRRNGLLVKCAKACNPSAEYLLAQLILETSTQLVHANMSKARLFYLCDYNPKYKHSHPKARDEAALASFMASFIPSQEPNPNPKPRPRPLSFHWEFVKLFMLKSTPSEIRLMHIELHCYIELFTGNESYECKFLHHVRMLIYISTITEDMLLVRACNDHFYKYKKRGFSLPLNKEIIDWRGAGAVFEEVRVKAVDALIAIIPILKSR